MKLQKIASLAPAESYPRTVNLREPVRGRSPGSSSPSWLWALFALAALGCGTEAASPRGANGAGTGDDGRWWEGGPGGGGSDGTSGKAGAKGEPPLEEPDPETIRLEARRIL